MAAAGDMRRFTVSLNATMLKRLDILAKEYSMTRSAVIGMMTKKLWEEDNHAEGGEDEIMCG